MAALITALNGPWHKRALQMFLVIVVAHWAEHILQAIQIWGLGWSRPDARGGLGLFYPWLVTSEWLHYFYAIVMLIGLILLRPGFAGRARHAWNIALGIQIWHHFEHLLLLGQALIGVNLFGAPVPTSILQLVLPRVELHLFYNAIVFAPMVIAMWDHVHPTAREAREVTCSCAHPHTNEVVVATTA